MKHWFAASLLLIVSTAIAGQSSPGWTVLIGADHVQGLRGWESAGLPTGWRVRGGELRKDGAVDDLVTENVYGDFELELDWKIGREGNSGVFYRGTREYDHIYWSAPEYQLLDDQHAPDGKSRLTAAAAAYGLYGAPANIVHPYGQWNHTRIVVDGKHVEHWLNGRKVVDYTLGSADWTARVAASKFSAYPHYGLAATGLIGIQGDHPGSLAIRALRVRALH